VISQRDPELNADQAAALRQLAGSGHGVDAMTALAGSGKTTLIGALAPFSAVRERRVFDGLLGPGWRDLE
jgi:Flp pilus assembly CpaF family ATPase